MSIEKIATGVPGLDVVTHGGLPAGRATLIAGRSGTCKSVLALQVASNWARVGLKPLIISVEEDPADLVTTGESLGFGVGELLAGGALAIADLQPPHDGVTVVTGEFDAQGLIHRVEHEVRQRGSRAVVLDSSTALFGTHRSSTAQLRAQFFALVYAFRRLGLTAIVTAEALADYGTSLTTLGVEDFVCDAVIILRNVVDGERRRRSVEVHKYRRSGHYKGQFPCTITTRGLTVFPLDAQGHEKVQASERYSSGVAGLDQMIQGGWIRDAIVLVRGPSGSGKTTLAGMYARAGAQRGERVIYYGFEETRGMLLRNFTSLGMAMEQYEEASNLKVVCRYPEATSLEDLLVDIRQGLDQFRPSLVVIDSISSIEHSASPLGFRQFMVGMASLLREHGRSALLNETVANDRSVDEVPYLSTIPDVILLLDHRQIDGRRQRTIRVHKMRGSGHEMEERAFRIKAGGVEVEALR